MVVAFASASSGFCSLEPNTPVDYFLPTSLSQHSRLPYVPQLMPPQMLAPYPNGNMGPHAAAIGSHYVSNKQQRGQMNPALSQSWINHQRKGYSDAFQNGHWSQAAAVNQVPKLEEDHWNARNSQRQSGLLSNGHKGMSGFSGFGNDMALQQRGLEQGVQKACHYDALQNTSLSEPKTGGVSSKLDYSLDIMSEFLCTMSSTIMGYKIPPSPVLIKFTHQLLSSTRLPGSTIILALVYLSKRCALQAPSAVDQTAQYNLLIVSLILANKFNDDNTFTNKSWGEVTGLPISELTRVETDWLKLVKWQLNLHDDDIGVWNRWNDYWYEYSLHATKKSSVHTPQVAPISQSHMSAPPMQCSADYWVDTRYDQEPAMRNRHGYYSNQYNVQSQYRYGNYSGAYCNTSQQQPIQLHQQQQQHLMAHQNSHNQHGLLSRYSSQCNCHYCVFEPIVPTWLGPAAAAC
ncbi:hypothetical protein BZA70DRAFT_125395 [Myxozyma melibiosi]|uniref:Cyclin-like protein n=1 Tax=Myxozyma melibiosi TaxID=54550 RepID=A0ABR1F8I1_9ASCO